ncbi:carbamoyltransferase C-terminal domain-containing protein [Saccharopolyspora taberi]|uniref:carbamoyltransferase C-terminal domain-containing protein n=1 Tax=Saccharopolyspora taberi TaxID=60895 RepID=UPI0031E2FD3E
MSGGYRHDAAACLVEDGVILAYVEEERLSRQRHAVGSGPRRCIDWVLEESGVELGDVDAVGLAWNPHFDGDVDEISADSPEYAELSASAFAGRDLPKTFYVDHHLAHAASAYRTSPYRSSLVLTIDGYGDARSMVVYRADGDRLVELASAGLQHSWGWLYQMVTEHTGLGSWQHAGKTMALAALGTPRYAGVFDEFRTFGQGFPSPEEVGMADVVRDNRRLGGAYYDEAESWLGSRLQQYGFEASRPRSPRYDRVTGARLHPPVADAAADLASSLQKTFEEYLEDIASTYLRREGLEHLCVAGGVGLNCKAMGSLLTRLPNLRGIYVPPVAADMGGALGAAVEVLNALGDHRRPDITDARLGPSYSDGDIAGILGSYGISHKRSNDIAADTADLVADGRVVGWFQGRAEVGPRALGARSIVARPDRDDLAWRANTQIKNREPWRPFSPSVLPGEYMNTRWKHADQASPHMALALDAVDVDGLAAVVHDDGTSRVQRVAYGEDDPYTALLREMEKRTGAPAVLNTSLNGREEPIVTRPPEALKLLFTSQMDALAMGSFLITK